MDSDQWSVVSGQWSVAGIGKQRKRGKLAHEADGFKADGDDLADETDDVFGGVGAVGVVDDAGAGGGGDAVLVYYPFEGAAVAEAVIVDFGRDAGEGALPG